MPLITCLNGHEIELLPDQFGQRIACPLCQLMIVVSPPRPGEPLLPKYEVLCDNKHVLRVKSKYLGTQIRCPQCQGLAWVTTDRLQRNIPIAEEEPIIPVAIAETVTPGKTAPVASSKPLPPIAAPLDDIPVAEVDEAPRVARKPLRKSTVPDDDNDETEGPVKLTKAERLNLNLVDQGLALITGSVVGFCSIKAAFAVLAFLMFLIAQGINTMEGHSNLMSFAEVLNWIEYVALCLNILAFAGGTILALFLPPIARARWGFLLSLLLLILFAAWKQFAPMVFSRHSFMDSFWIYYMGYEALFLLSWIMMLLGAWQIAKYARKPLTRQSIIILGLIGLGCWVIMVFTPKISAFLTMTRAVIWAQQISMLFLTLGAAAILIFKHLSVMESVRNCLGRFK